MTKGRLIACFCAGVAIAGAARADPPPFDLAGPTLRVSVTHAGVTLPIAEAPNLSEGDALSIEADLPASQSVRYLLIAAFLRGATNPPPKSWFFRAETWTPNGRRLAIKVPPEAEQAIVFLAPSTSGDFATLVGAVRGRPGAFVRAAQDLNQASLDRSRLDAFLAAMSASATQEPERLKAVSSRLARSLSIKLNTGCFERPPELQAACLVQGPDALILNDGHSRSMIEAVTSGPSADLAFQLGASPAAGYGVSSPYIGAAFDIARILDSFRTAQFQYIPALSRMSGDRLALVLNAPPSFQNPRSVLVAALPPVEPPQPPPLRAVDPAGGYCAAQPDLVLPMEGAPLVYSSRYARGMTLRTTAKDGATLDLPVTADPAKGGLTVDAQALAAARLSGPMEGALHGDWGFVPFDGPAFRLQTPRAAPWRLAQESRASLVAGRDDVVKLEDGASACVREVTLQASSGDVRVLDWKTAGADALTVTVPLGDARPGPATLRIAQYGQAQPDTVALQVLDPAARLDGFDFHAGDATGVLTGARLDEVASLTFAGVTFAPGALVARDGADALTLTAADPAAAARLAVGQSATAKVSLEDGRTLRVKATVAAARPQASLIGMSLTPPGAGAFRLGNPAELPRGSRLTFSLRADGATRFAGGVSVEVAPPDGAGSAELTLADGLTEADAAVLVATLDTAKAFGPSVFGPLRYRVVQGSAAGDWRPLATLVRLPKLQGLQCPATAGRCRLDGEDLFLIDAVSRDPALADAEPVSAGYTGRSMSVPRPRDGRLYVRLHDDPGVVSEIVF